ncbi:MAG: hypothetical protein ACRC0L_07150 [Angustibacter sp.]
MQAKKALSRTAPNEITIRRPDPDVWQAALKLAGGDHRRLEVQEDGTVLVRND